MSMLGRSALLRGDLDRANNLLNRAIAIAIAIAEADSWLAFFPWPQAFLGEVMVERGDLDGARQVLKQAFARACQIGDPCWEGVTGRGLALLAEAEGEPDEAIRVLQDALKRCSRLSDTYKWAEVYILEAQCRLGVARGHESAEEWVAELIEISSRTGMRELLLQAMILKTPPEKVPSDPSINRLAENISNPRILSALQA